MIGALWLAVALSACDLSDPTDRDGPPVLGTPVDQATYTKADFYEDLTATACRWELACGGSATKMTEEECLESWPPAEQAAWTCDATGNDPDEARQCAVAVSNWVGEQVGPCRMMGGGGLWRPLDTFEPCQTVCVPTLLNGWF